MMLHRIMSAHALVARSNDVSVGGFDGSLSLAPFFMKKCLFRRAS